MADVYDTWYDGISDVDATVARLAALAGKGPVLELGVGTGRLAIPLGVRGVSVHGVDTSPEMLERLRAKPNGGLVQLVQGDMAGADPPGPFSLVYAAYNTLFSLTSAAAQQRCFDSVAARLDTGGRFVVEAFVPEVAGATGGVVEVRELTADRVVLSVSRFDAGSQAAEGQFVEISETHGVRLRPWSVRWSTPEQLDDMATEAGLVREHRWSGWDAEPYEEGDSSLHVSVWRRSSPRAS